MKVGINVQSSKVYLAIVSGGMTTTIELTPADAFLVAAQIKNSAETLQEHKPNASSGAIQK